jgi:hypothetical protein
MKLSFAAACAISTALTSVATAQPASTDSPEALRAEIEALRDRLDALDASSEADDRLEFSGDLRFRHETINDDAASTERNRQRIRARLRMNADLSDDLTVGFTLATGASNPVSANQSLDGGFSRKDIGFDRAFFGWDVNEQLNLTGGKMGLPFFRPGGHHLIFDSDLNPEGLFMEYDGSNVFANIGGFWVEERSSGDDAILFSLQSGYQGSLGDNAELTVGLSYYDYRDTQGFAPFYRENNGQGNTTIDLDPNDGIVNLVNDYNLAELFAEVEFEAGGQPLRVFLDYVENTEASSFDTGYALGFRWRSASNPGDWEVGWSYEDLEADAVVAAFTDSDFGGGGTDGKGHVLRGAYRLRSNVRLNGTYFLNEAGAAAGNERDYKRLQLDISFMF